ncbi:MAG: hypothetical protein ACJASL_004728 [Paraglaciecola sp.]|jgi:hypothetical protein
MSLYFKTLKNSFILVFEKCKEISLMHLNEKMESLAEEGFQTL